ncbi:MAG: patatin-like phospholipase family protein [archaeon]
MKTAFVLTSGSSAGAFQVGAIKKLISEGIKPNVIISTSVGAINGARLACKGDLIDNINALEKCWLSANKKKYFPKNKNVNLPLYSIEGLKKILNKYLPAKNFKELMIPLYIRAIRSHDGKTVFFDKGNLIDCVLASCSVYPLFPPYNISGVEYKDGFNGTEGEIEKAIKLGYKRIFVIDSSGILTDFFRRLNLIKKDNKISKKIIKNFDGEIIEIKAPKRVSYFYKSFKHAKKLMKLGEKQAEKAIKKINS